MIARLALVVSLLAEALAIYVVAETLAAAYADNHDIGAVSFVTFMVLILAAFGIQRATEHFDIAPARGYAILGVLTFVFLYGAMRIEFARDLAIWDFTWAVNFVREAEGATSLAAPVMVGSILMVVTWARGAYRATGDLELELIPRQLSIPFGVVITMCVLGAWSERIDIIGRAAVAFFAMAVLALALSQSALSGATIGNAKSSGITGTLLGLTAIATAICVLIFGIVFGFLGRQFGGLVEDAVYLVLLIVLTPIAWVFDLVFGWLLGNLNLDAAIEPDPVFQDGAGEGEEPRSGSNRAVLGAWRVLLLLAALAVVGAVIAVVTRLYRRARRPDEAAPTRASAGSLGEDLRSLFRNPFAGRGSSGPPAGEDAVALYRRVLHEGERGGRPRAPFETPAEYAPELQNLFHVEVTDEITAAFVEARYAGRAPDLERIRELERRWKESGH